MSVTIDTNSLFNFKGARYSFEEFKEAYDLEDTSDEQVLEVIRILHKKGSLKIDEGSKTKQQKALEKASKEESISKLADAIDAEEEQAKDFKAKQKREERLTYELIEVSYPTYSKAIEAKQLYEKNLRLNNIDIIQRGESILLAFRDITDNDLNYINRTYLADKAINATVNTVEKGIGSVTGAVDYTARKIVSPTFQIGAKASANLLKSLAHVVVKTGATVISAGSQGIKETKEAISNDPDVIRAGRELIDAKDGVMRTVTGKTSGTSAGINIIR